jgi:hypothetical protein
VDEVQILSLHDKRFLLGGADFSTKGTDFKPASRQARPTSITHLGFMGTK